MHIQYAIFKPEQEKELNAFLTTAHLYHTEGNPAIRISEGNVYICHRPDPSRLDTFVATETILAHILHNRELLIEDEMKIRQLQWRIQEKRERIGTLNTDKLPLEKRLAEVKEEIKALPNAKKSMPADEVKANADKRENLQAEMNSIGAKLSEINEELNGSGPKDAGIVLQVENAEADITETREKMEDRRKDIDMGLAFVAELESGEFEIYKQPKQ